MTVCRTFSSTARMAEQALLVGDHLVLHALVEVAGRLRIDVRVAPGSTQARCMSTNRMAVAGGRTAGRAASGGAG